MQEHIQLINYQGKQILLVDFSNCSATEVEKIARAIPDHVTVQTRGSVLVLVDFTRALFDGEAIRVMKETAVFNKPYVKKSAWIGADQFPKEFYESLKSFSRREFPTFRTREDALAWLVED